MRILTLFLVGCAVPTTMTETEPESPEDVEPSGVIVGDDDPTMGVESPHLQLGIAVDGTPDDDHLVVHEQFATSYSRFLNVPNWVSWRTRAIDFGPVPRYEGPFYPDESLPADWFHPDTDVYVRSGYDRGHMLRSEERTRTADENFSTFILTNVLPQRPDLNRGVWFDFELYVQRRVQSKTDPKDAYVIAGAIWPAACATHTPRTIGDGCADIGRLADPAFRIAIPEATWKIVAFVPAGTPLTDAADAYVVAVVMPNINGIENDRWWEYRATVADIEQRSGYDVPRVD